MGCVVALEALRISSAEATRANVLRAADRLGAGLREIQAAHPGWFTEIRQSGLVMGLVFAHAEGAKIVMRHLYELGVWAIFSTLDPRVLQFKPGTLIDADLCEELLALTGEAITRAAEEAATLAARDDAA